VSKAEQGELTENQFTVSLFDIGGTDTDELDTLSLQKVQSVVQVLKLLHLHARALVRRDALRRDNLEKSVQVKTVVQVGNQVFDLHHALYQVGVYPSGEGLVRLIKRDALCVTFCCTRTQAGSSSDI
jgi:hypothetical protein